ncbi:MAG: UDP-3-O-(3-hydroxymyristoyl)glucosamine N-acyltransferase [Gemmatimonadales bacterium]|nr:MAG: UDP-3-O-(3-hydroxymyristoyl)glucosamine N-acyltransferase [Gemmatimonadales bacterium]
MFSGEIHPMSSFPRYERVRDSVPLSELSRWVDGHLLGEGDPEIQRIVPLAQAEAGEMGLLAARGYLGELAESSAAAFLVSEELAGELPDGGPPALVVPDAHQALAILLERLVPATPTEPEIHSTAIVSPSASLATGVSLGPYAVVEDDVTLGRDVRVGAHCVIGAGVQVGEESRIFPHVVLYPGTQIGRRVWIHSGARLGVDGFGYVFRDGGHRKVPQVGRCIVEDDVEIGANTTVDRGSIGDTRIRRGVKVDNLVQLGHNTEVGEHTVLAAQVGVAGSTRLGAGVMAGGQVGVGGHLTVGDGARLSGQAGIIGDVPAGETVTGFPARPRLEFLRSIAAQKKSGDLLRRVRSLERAMGEREEG